MNSPGPIVSETSESAVTWPASPWNVLFRRSIAMIGALAAGELIIQRSPAWSFIVEHRLANDQSLCQHHGSIKEQADQRCNHDGGPEILRARVVVLGRVDEHDADASGRPD